MPGPGIVQDARMSTEPRRFPRAPGLLILLGVVVIGLLSGAIPFRIKAPEVRDGIIAELAEKEREVTTPEARLEAWLKFGVPQIHNRLRMLAFSPSMPFLISHGVREPGGLVELWGVDFLRPDSIQVTDTRDEEGLVIEVHVPAPHNLGSGRLEGDNAERVPLYDSLEEVPDPQERVEELIEWFLGGMQKAVARDIPGVRMEVLVDLPAQERAEAR